MKAFQAVAVMMLCGVVGACKSERADKMVMHDHDEAIVSAPTTNPPDTDSVKATWTEASGNTSHRVTGAYAAGKQVTATSKKPTEIAKRSNAGHESAKTATPEHPKGELESPNFVRLQFPRDARRDRLVRVRVFYATDRKRDPGVGKGVYGTEWHDDVEYGVADVTIPPGHHKGHLESPSILRLQFSEDAHRDVVLQSVTPESPDAVLAQMSRSVDQSDEKAVMLFVHGFNVTFNDAARRTGQLAYDMSLHLTPFLFSWASKGSPIPTAYTNDENTAELAAPHLVAVIQQIALQTHARTFHIVSHSMGSVVVTKALMALAGTPHLPVINNVVLAAPDLDATQFRSVIEPSIRDFTQRITIYTSNHDEALRIAHSVWGMPRLGEAPIGGLDNKTEIIDASLLPSDWLGHSYVGENIRVLDDLFDNIVRNIPASHRALSMVKLPDKTYWEFAQ